MLKLTCNLGNRALIQHHLSNSLLVDLNFIYVHHLCKGAGFQAPCSLMNTSYLYDMDDLWYRGKHITAKFVQVEQWT